MRGFDSLSEYNNINQQNQNIMKTIAFYILQLIRVIMTIAAFVIELPIKILAAITLLLAVIVFGITAPISRNWRTSEWWNTYMEYATSMNFVLTNYINQIYNLQ